LNWAKNTKTPKTLHIKTIQGKGFAQTEKDQTLWHAPGKFDKISGERIKTKSAKTYPQILGESLLKIFEEKPNPCALTPAMLT
ncbi:1-deoxy-D-xylulose-5-phosphate synthase, partial [Ornithobacterium rhinotracheale]